MERREDSDSTENETVAYIPQDNDSLRVLVWFLLYSMAMFSIPLAAFFGTKYTLKRTFHMEGFASTAWSVVAAVVVVNIIILSYACRGYEEAREDFDAKNERERDESSPSSKKDD